MRKMDEMELSISHKAIKWSWAFMVLSLAIWGISHYIQYRESSLPLTLFFMQFVVYFFATSVEKSKVGDQSGKKHLLMSLGFVILLVGFGVLLYATTGR